MTHNISPSEAEALIPRFKLDKILNQDQGGRRLALLGSIDAKPSLLLIERSALPSSSAAVAALHAALTSIQNLGANDVYHWYLASYAQHHRHQPSSTASETTPPTPESSPGLKLNLIHPCTPKHVKKYTPQTPRLVVETPRIYAERVRPFIERERGAGRLDWVLNIVEGRTEQEDIIARESCDLGKDDEGFLLLPDMNWDRATMSNLRVLGLVERRDLWSMRDLRKRDVPWLRRMHARVVRAVAARYGAEGVEEDMLKVYVHYQPTYYHFHLHVVSTALEPNATQATGKAFLLMNLVAMLEAMEGGEEAGLMDVDVAYTVGDGSDLWRDVFGPLKEERKAKDFEKSGS